MTILTSLMAGVTGPVHRLTSESSNASRVAPHSLFFELTILDDTERSPNRFAQVQRSLRAKEIQAGHKYVVRAVASTHPSAIKQDQKPLIPMEAYRLAFGFADEEKFGLLLSQAAFSVDALAPGTELHCELQVPEKCPHGEIELMLIVVGPENTNTLAACVHLKVLGTYYEPNSTFQEQVNVSLAAERAEGTILLSVRKDGPNTFRFEGWATRDRPKVPPNGLPNPHIELATFVEGQIAPEKIHNRMREWAHGNPGGLMSWLNALRLSTESVLDLIIMDETDFQIPWEMLEYDLQEEIIAIGTSMRVSRWVKIERNYEPQYLSLQDENVSGQVLAHIDRASLTQAEDDSIALARFSVIETEDLEQFRHALCSLKTMQVGLLYLGCHGVYAISSRYKNLLEHALKSKKLEHPKSARVISQLSLYEIPALSGERPVLFVNACHSARVLHDGDAASEVTEPIGFPIAALKRIARAYVGTTGPVGDEYAGKIAGRVLSRIAEGITVAEALRLERSAALQSVTESSMSGDKQTKTDIETNYIYTFMYVYYGNPAAKLHLMPNQIPGDTSRE